MGFRFRKSRHSVKILPGVRLNIGKKGITSVSIGRRGKFFSATTNISKEGLRHSFTIRGIGTFETASKSTSGANHHPTPQLNSRTQVPPPKLSTRQSPQSLNAAINQGDVKALEGWMNQAFAAENVEVRVTYSGYQLKILLRGAEAPGRRFIPAIQNGLQQLCPPGFESVAVTSKTIRGRTAWTEQWTLDRPNRPSLCSATNSNHQATVTGLDFFLSNYGKQVIIALLALGFWGTIISVLYSTGSKIYEGRQSLALALEQVAEASTDTTDLSTLTQSQQTLEQALTALEAIPSLPGSGRITAEAEIPAVQEKLSLVKSRIEQEEVRLQREAQANTDLEEAKRLAQAASEIVQNPPHPIAVWQDAKSHWDSAVTLLEGIPTGTEVSPEAQEKLAAYQANQAAIASRVTLEEQASIKYEAGRQAADQLIEFTRGLDYPDKDDLPKLKQTQTQLEELIRTFRSIPSGTSASDAAKQRLDAHTEDYQDLMEIIGELQACDAASSYSNCMTFDQVRISVFADAEASYGDTPVRESMSGSCQCPYDRDSAGNQCGARSAYSRPGGDSPICYR